MADSPAASPEPTSPTTPEPSDDTEKNYWKRLESLLDSRIDEAVKRHLPGRSDPGTQRTGRTTFRDMIAEFMGGPFGPPKS